jgi:hypothetical protein
MTLLTYSISIGGPKGNKQLGIRPHSSVNIVTNCGLNDREIGVGFRTGTENFVFPAAPRLVLVAPYVLSNGHHGLFPGVERLELSPSSAEVKNAWSYTLIPPHVVYCQIQRTEVLTEMTIEIHLYSCMTPCSLVTYELHLRGHVIIT